VALLLDVLALNLIAALIGAIVNLVASLAGHSGGLSTGAAIAGAVAWWLWIVSYFVVFWTLTGQTPGSRLLGIRVQSPDGHGLHALQSVRRFGGLILAALPLGAGFVPVLLDDRRRALQDRIAGTVVRWVPENVADFPVPDLPVRAAPGLELKAESRPGPSTARPAP
jgi:uncharacterized RDD family membrane protein YckC